jgi:hypothetical protein
MSQTRQITIYTTLGCHLCEQAIAMLQPLQTQGIIALTEVDIADYEELLETYGLRIPVLRRQDNDAELGWPFGLEKVEGFLQTPI